MLDLLPFLDQGQPEKKWYRQVFFRKSCTYYLSCKDIFNAAVIKHKLLYQFMEGRIKEKIFKSETAQKVLLPWTLELEFPISGYLVHQLSEGSMCHLEETLIFIFTCLVQFFLYSVILNVQNFWIFILIFLCHQFLISKASVVTLNVSKQSHAYFKIHLEII